MRSVSRQTMPSTSPASVTSSSCVNGRSSSFGPTRSWCARGSRPPSGRRRVTRTRATDDSVMRVVDRTRVGDADREAEAVDRRVVAHRLEAVHHVRRDVHEVALRYLTFLVTDRHQPAPRRDVIELVRRVLVRVDEATTGDLELAHQLEVAALRDVAHLAGTHEPPNGNGPVVLDDRRDLLDRPHVHRVPFHRRRLTPASAYRRATPCES